MLTKNGQKIVVVPSPKGGAQNVGLSQDTGMGEQRILQQADGWHFKIRGGNTVGPFDDYAAAERAVANYAKRWQQRTSAVAGGWRNWRRTPSPLAVMPGTALDAGGSEPVVVDGKPTPTLRTGS